MVPAAGAGWDVPYTTLPTGICRSNSSSCPNTSTTNGFPNTGAANDSGTATDAYSASDACSTCR